MNQKTALLISAVVTSFLLVVAGGVAARVIGPATAPAPTDPPTSLPPTATIDPAVQAAIQQREATYQQEIQQANAQLQEAYAKQQELANQLAQAQQAGASGGASAYPISSDVAITIALNAAQGAQLARAPELVRFEGRVAYEVTMDRGKVYVDAISGQVLANTAATFSAPPAQAPTSSGSHEGEHEEHGDD